MAKRPRIPATYSKPSEERTRQLAADGSRAMVANVRAQSRTDELTDEQYEEHRVRIETAMLRLAGLEPV